MNTSQGGDSPPYPVARAETPKSSHAHLRTGLALLFGIGVFAVVMSWLMREPGMSQDPAAARALEGLHSGNPSERLSALRQVVQFGMGDSDRSIPAVLEALKDTDPAVRARAAESLAMLGSYAVMASGSEERGDPGLVTAVTSALFGSLAKDEDSVVRAAAADALRNISVTRPRAAAQAKRGSKKAAGGPAEASTPATSPVDQKAVMAALTAALGDRNDEVRAAAATALGGAGPSVWPEPPQPLVAALSDGSATTRAATVKALANFPSGLDPLIPLVIRMSANDTPSVHEACAQALGEIKRSAYSAAAVPALIEGLKDRDREVRLQVAVLLATLGPKATSAIPALIATLQEPIESDRTTTKGGLGSAFTTVYTGPAHEAAKALGEIAPGTSAAGTAVAALAEVVRAGPRQRRASAAEALGEFGPKAAGAIPDLIQMLKESDSSDSTIPNRDSAAAAEALVRIAPDSPSVQTVVSALRASLHSKQKMSHPAIIRSLARLGPKGASALPDIQALQNDSDPTISKAATRAIKALGGK